MTFRPESCNSLIRKNMYVRLRSPHYWKSALMESYYRNIDKMHYWESYTMYYRRNVYFLNQHYREIRTMGGRTNRGPGVLTFNFKKLFQILETRGSSTGGVMKKLPKWIKLIKAYLYFICDNFWYSIFDIFIQWWKKYSNSVKTGQKMKKKVWFLVPIPALICWIIRLIREDLSGCNVVNCWAVSYQNTKKKV